MKAPHESKISRVHVSFTRIDIDYESFVVQPMSDNNGHVLNSDACHKLAVVGLPGVGPSRPEPALKLIFSISIHVIFYNHGLQPSPIRPFKLAVQVLSSWSQPTTYSIWYGGQPWPGS